MFRFGEYQLEYPGLMNAGGMIKSIQDLARVLPAVNAAVVGTITILDRPGTTGDNYYFDPVTSTSYNRLDLPNRGKTFYEQILPEMVRLAHEQNKPLIANIAGFTLAEFVELAVMAALAGVDGIELNFGCPNTRHPILSYQPREALEVVRAVRNALFMARRQVTLGAKLSPEPSPERRAELRTTMIDEVDYVVLTNGLPNMRGYRSDGSPALSAVDSDGHTHHTGAAGGAALRAISLAMTAEFAEHVPVLRVGGILTGRDLLESEWVGASGVQVATAYMNEGPKAFTRLLQELAELS